MPLTTYLWQAASAAGGQAKRWWWLGAGLVLSGPLAGKQLTAAVHTNELWFARAAFNPEARVYAAGDEQRA